MHCEIAQSLTYYKMDCAIDPLSLVEDPALILTRQPYHQFAAHSAPLSAPALHTNLECSDNKLPTLPAK